MLRDPLLLVGYAEPREASNGIFNVGTYIPTIQREAVYFGKTCGKTIQVACLDRIFLKKMRGRYKTKKINAQNDMK